MSSAGANAGGAAGGSAGVPRVVIAIVGAFRGSGAVGRGWSGSGVGAGRGESIMGVGWNIVSGELAWADTLPGKLRRARRNRQRAELRARCECMTIPREETDLDGRIGSITSDRLPPAPE
jgi:hypothetical protein